MNQFIYHFNFYPFRKVEIFELPEKVVLEDKENEQMFP